METKKHKFKASSKRKEKSYSSSSSDNSISNEISSSKSDDSDSLSINEEKAKEKKNREKKRKIIDTDSSNMKQLRQYLESMSYNRSLTGMKRYQLVGLSQAVMKHGIPKDIPNQTKTLPRLNNELDTKKIKYYTSIWMPDTEIKNENFLSHLEEHGWAVWKNAVSIDKTQQLLNSFLDWLEAAEDDNGKTSFDRDDSNSWSIENIPHSVKGIIKGHGIGHTEFLWEARELCKFVFDKIYPGEPLLVSFDGASFYPPSKKKELEPRFHSDQGRWKADFECIQGILNLKSCGPKDGGFLFIEGSHKLHKKYRKLHPHDLWNWHLADVKSAPLGPLRWMKVCCEPGDLICFNSKLFHSGILPTKKSGNYRAGLYISFQPKKYATDKELEKRERYYKTSTMTGHWCYGPWFASSNAGFAAYNKYTVKTNEFEFKSSKSRKKLAY